MDTLEGPVLVVAGAGTGKTRVIEYRVLRLVDRGVSPHKILLLTFTRKAAREMLARTCGHNECCARVEGGTFHSFAYKVIRRYYHKLGMKENFSFIDDADAAQAVGMLIDKCGAKRSPGRFPRKDTLQAIFSAAFNHQETFASLLAKNYPQFSQAVAQIEKINREYQEYKFERGLIDYNDMLFYLRVLLDDDEIKEAMRRRYAYVMVDEFQDTNKIQADIACALGAMSGNILVVGDDTQSIYSFRGAHYRNMFDFPRRFPGTKIIKLEENYRSTQPILDLANAIIAEEREKYTKALYAVRRGKDKPRLNYFQDAHSEALWVVENIRQMQAQGVARDKIG
ncbi:MAG: ATP-dependent helicase, partial [Candidatus Omnitrophota bacterium]